MPLTYPDILKSNNPESYGIVPAKEVAGHKEVTNLEALYALAAPILSETYYTTEVKDESGNVIGIEEHDYENAIGQLWYVASVGKHYQLVDWANRKSASGWKEFKSGGGSKNIPFNGFQTTEITEIGETCEAPTKIWFYTVEGVFIAQDANGYYYDWEETTIYPASEDYGTYESGINPHSDRNYYNTANGTLYVYDANEPMILTRAVRPRVAYGTCSTAASVAEKIVTLHDDFKDWRLEVGAEVIIKFTYSDSATGTTFNVNGTGAKKFKYNGTLMSGNFLGTQAGVSSRFVYDGEYYIWMGWHRIMTYSPQGLGFGYSICNTDAATIAKTAALSGYNLTTNGIVSIKFTNSVPANATLNINSKGAKPIFYRGSAIVAGVINAGDVVTFIYDGTNYIYLGTDNALSRCGGTVTGELVFDNPNDDNDTTTNDPFVTISHDSIKLEHGMNDSDRTILTTKKVESPMIAKTGGTSDQVLMADGSVAGTITTAWLEANLT